MALEECIGELDDEEQERHQLDQIKGSFTISFAGRNPKEHIILVSCNHDSCSEDTM